MPTDTKKSVNNSDFKLNRPPTLEGDYQSEFFPQDTAIDVNRFNQSFPYQLLLVIAENKDGKVSYKPTKWTFTLPIPPQELILSMPFTSNVQATLGGISEQHGGAPFRDITLSGTTGITPIKNNAGPLDQGNNSTFNAIFAGTVQNINAAAQAISVTATGQTQQMPNVNLGLGEINDPNNIPRNSTGYAQWRILQRMMESYAELKKKNQNINLDGETFNSKDLRLAFAVWKDEAIYLVTGVNFQTKRSASNPMEYMYSLQMKAWKRVKLAGSINTQLVSANSRSPNAFASLLTRMMAINETLQKTNDIFKSIVQDPTNRLKEISRETTLGLKTAIGFATNPTDYPATIQRDLINQIVKDWETVSNQIQDFNKYPPSVFKTGLDKLYSTSNTLQFDGPLTTPSTNSSNLEINDILSQIDLSQLKISTILSNNINSEQERVSQFNRLDYEIRRDEVRSFSDDFANAVGAGAEVYNETYNLTPNPTARTPTEDEYNILFALNEMAMVLDHLAASDAIDPITLTSEEYVAGLAEASGIAFTIPQSKYAVPFPYGFTLERLALQYLGDANRWHEIATLNGLRAPYVDEEGFNLPFLTNGNGNLLYISDKTNLYINQTIYISSSSKLRSRRHITKIKEIYSGYIEVTVDGDSDLSTYLVSNVAILEGFLPGTVNSQQIIYIPSDITVEDNTDIRAVPGVDAFDPLLQISGVDLLLNQNGDLAITPDGDCRLAYGLQNIVQSVKLALTTPRGSLLQHPSYGLNLQPGMSTADVSAQDIVKEATQMFNNDPTFTGVKGATVVKDGPTVQITLIIGIKALSTNIPITLNIVR